MPTLRSKDELLDQVEHLLYWTLDSNSRYCLTSWAVSDQGGSLVINCQVFEQPMTTLSSALKASTEPPQTATSYITYGEGGLTYVEE